MPCICTSEICAYQNLCTVGARGIVVTLTVKVMMLKKNCVLDK